MLVLLLPPHCPASAPKLRPTNLYCPPLSSSSVRKGLWEIHLYPCLGIRRIQRHSPAWIRGLPYPISSSTSSVLHSWRLGKKPLPPSPSSPLHLFLPFSPPRFHYSSPFFSTTSQGLGYKLLLRDTKPPLISAPTAPAKTGLCPPNSEG